MPLRIIGWRGFSVYFVVLAFLLMMAQRCATLRPTHPMYGQVERVNKFGGPYIGLLMTFPTELRALTNSGFFIPNPHIPRIHYAGRIFNIGQIKGVDVIYVMSGEQTSNAAATSQILVDLFHIKGIVHYGIAGSANNSLLVGDVSIPNYAAFTGSWHWMEEDSEGNEYGLPVLKIGDFNLPKKGRNALGRVEFSPEELYSVGNPMKKVFWLPVNREWLAMASHLKNVSLVRCINETACLSYTPKVAHGLNASTADIYVHNAAYREFLFSKFNVSTVDEESSAVVKTSLSNAVPCIVFRGVSDAAGAQPAFPSSDLLYLAARNAVIVAVQFIALFK